VRLCVPEKGSLNRNLACCGDLLHHKQRLAHIANPLSDFQNPH
jgi:hypothetical protein